MRRSIPLLVALLLTASLARADVVDPPPVSCPSGATPATAHSGPYCAPTPPCTSDAECGAGERCLEVQQCLETRACGGLAPPDSGLCTLTHVAGACDAAGACAGDATCSVRRVCARESAAGGDDGGCSCAAPGSRRAHGRMAIALAAAALLWIARRRPR